MEILIFNQQQLNCEKNNFPAIKKQKEIIKEKKRKKYSITFTN